MLWATIEDVSYNIGLQPDERMTECLDAANAWAQRTRPDLDADAEAPHDVRHAVILYASVLYRSRATLGAVAQYESFDQPDEVSNAMANIYRLIGYHKPVAR